MRLGPNLRLAKSFTLERSGPLRQQNVVSQLFERVKTCLHVVVFSPDVLKHFVGIVFRSCQRSARPFQNRRCINRGGNECPRGVTRRLIPLAGDGERALSSERAVLEWGCDLLEQVLDECMAVSNMCSLSNVPHWLQNSMMASFRRIHCWSCQHRHQCKLKEMVLLCKAVCEEEKSRCLDPLMKSWNHYLPVTGRVLYKIFIVIFVFGELDEVLDRLKQAPFQPVCHIDETTDTSGFESEVCGRWQKVLSKKTYQIVKRGRLMNLRAYLWLGLQIPRPYLVIPIANFFVVMFLCWLMAYFKFYVTTKAQSILQWTSAYVWRRLVGLSLITVNFRCPRKRLDVSKPKSWGHHLSRVIRSISIATIWSLMELVW